MTLIDQQIAKAEEELKKSTTIEWERYWLGYRRALLNLAHASGRKHPS